MTAIALKAKKEITIKLLKGENCSNCLHYGHTVTTSSNIQVTEWCTRRDIMPKLRTCKWWEDGKDDYKKYNF